MSNNLTYLVTHIEVIQQNTFETTKQTHSRDPAQMLNVLVTIIQSLHIFHIVSLTVTSFTGVTSYSLSSDWKHLIFCSPT